MDIGPAQTEPVNGAWTEVVYEDICTTEQFRDNALTERGLQVDGDTALSPVKPNKIGRVAVDDGVIMPREVTLTWTLKLDHVGPQVGEVAGTERRRNRLLESEDVDSLEWSLAAH